MQKKATIKKKLFFKTAICRTSCVSASRTDVVARRRPAINSIRAAASAAVACVRLTVYSVKNKKITFNYTIIVIVIVTQCAWAICACQRLPVRVRSLMGVLGTRLEPPTASRYHCEIRECAVVRTVCVCVCCEKRRTTFSYSSRMLETRQTHRGGGQPMLYAGFKSLHKIFVFKNYDQ